ncbi:MAG: hypothetical protein AAF518_28915, partial [Spirochaetota bacterium]
IVFLAFLVNCSWYTASNNKNNNNEKTSLLALITPQATGTENYGTSCGVPSSPLNMMIYQFLVPHPYTTVSSASDGALSGFEPWQHNDCKPTKAFLRDISEIGNNDVTKRTVEQTFTYNSSEYVTEVKTTGKKEIAAGTAATISCPANSGSSATTVDVVNTTTYSYDSENRITEISQSQTCGDQTDKGSGLIITKGSLPSIGKYTFSYDSQGRVTQIAIFAQIEGTTTGGYSMTSKPYQQIDISYSGSEVTLKKSFFAISNTSNTTYAMTDTVYSELNYTISVSSTDVTGMSGTLSCKSVSAVSGVSLDASIPFCAQTTVTNQTAEDLTLTTDVLLDNDNKLLGYKEAIPAATSSTTTTASSLRFYGRIEARSTSSTATYYNYTASYDIWGRTTSVNTVDAEYDNGTLIRLGTVVYGSK